MSSFVFLRHEVHQKERRWSEAVEDLECLFRIVAGSVQARVLQGRSCGCVTSAAAQGPELGLLLCCGCLEILSASETRPLQSQSLWGGDVTSV